MSQETNSAPRVENKMGTMPIAKLLFPAADSSYSCCHRDRRWYECLTIQVAW